MTQFARELFARMLAMNPLVYVAETSSYRERTDEELDVFVKYAMRAAAACEREDKRYREAHPVPTGVPSGGYQPRPPKSPTTLPTSLIERAIRVVLG